MKITNEFAALNSVCERDIVVDVIRETPYSETLGEALLSVVVKPLEPCEQANQFRLSTLRIAEGYLSGRLVTKEEILALKDLWTDFLLDMAHLHCATLEALPTVRGKELGKQSGKARASWHDWIRANTPAVIEKCGTKHLPANLAKLADCPYKDQKSMGSAVSKLKSKDKNYRNMFG